MTQSYRLRLLENTKLQSSMSCLGSSFIFTALRISQMSMPCWLADLKMQFWTYFWRFRQCHLNFMPFASSLHAECEVAHIWPLYRTVSYTLKSIGL